jgi:hypothetical protein
MLEPWDEPNISRQSVQIRASVLRSPRAEYFSLRPSVERTAADWRNFVGRGGGFDRSALDQSEINLDCLREK